MNSKLKLKQYSSRNAQKGEADTDKKKWWVMIRLNIKQNIWVQVSEDQYLFLHLQNAWHERIFVINGILNKNLREITLSSNFFINLAFYKLNLENNIKDEADNIKGTHACHNTIITCKFERTSNFY